MTRIAPGSPFTILQTEPRWVGWRTETRKGRSTKVPYMPGTGRLASVTDPSTWGSHAAACAMRGVDGQGFVLTGHENLAACDFDHCIDPGTGEVVAVGVGADRSRRIPMWNSRHLARACTYGASMTGTRRKPSCSLAARTARRPKSTSATAGI